QPQPTLPLVAGVIDDDDMTAAAIAGPGIGDEAVRGPVAGPGRLRLELRPSAIAEGVRVQYPQQPGVERRDLLVWRLDRTAAKMGRHPNPGALELALMEEPQAGGQKGNDCRRLVLRPNKFGCGARLVVIF